MTYFNEQVTLGDENFSFLSVTYVVTKTETWSWLVNYYLGKTIETRIDGLTDIQQQQ